MRRILEGGRHFQRRPTSGGPSNDHQAFQIIVIIKVTRITKVTRVTKIITVIKVTKMIMKLTLPIREIGVHLAAKVFEEAVREKSSMVTNLDIFNISLIVLLIVLNHHRHLNSVQHMNKEMYEHFQFGGLEELKSYIRSKTFLKTYIRSNFFRAISGPTNKCSGKFSATAPYSTSSVWR